jgi:N-methylhydantoinase A
MGGTSYDVCLIRDGRPELRSDWNWRHRYCIALPMVDIASIGAGGGSIARVEEGILHVGPESAGSQPGPVCYSRGGTQPTVTDADLVLGRLDAGAFWGGRMRLDEEAARNALEAVGRPTGLDVEATAAAVVALVDAHMTDAVRRVLSLAGADPRRLELVAFGGMGAVHATTQAAALGMQHVLIPRAAPGFSALGLLTADHVVDATRTLLSSWADVDLPRLDLLADELESAARAELSAAGVPESRLRFEWLLNLVYPGQTFDRAMPLARHDTPIDGSRIDADAVKAAVDEFHRRNEEARLIEARAQEPTVRGVRLIATGLVDRPEPLVLAEAALPEPIASRRLFVSDAWSEAPVYDAAALAPGPELKGPAIVQSRFTTLVLRPGDRARVLTNGDTLVAVAP